MKNIATDPTTAYPDRRRHGFRTNFSKIPWHHSKVKTVEKKKNAEVHRLKKNSVSIIMGGTVRFENSACSRINLFAS